jgi:general secretion pathway protein E
MEYLRCTADIKTMPKDSRFSLDARRYMKENRIRDLSEDGFLKVLRGTSTIEEVLRVAG